MNKPAADQTGTILYLPSVDKRYLLEPYRFYLQEARKRIFPPFADIDTAMKEYADEWYQKAGSWFDPDNDDETAFAEQAYEKGINYGLMLEEMANNVRLAVLAGLHHRWEKDLREWMIKELSHTARHPDLPQVIQKATFPMLSELLTALGVPVTTLPCWATLERFGLVVNVFKHGDGPAMNKLKMSAPEYFGPWHLPDARNWKYVSHHDLHVTEAQFDELAATVTDFWNGIPERVTEEDAVGALPAWYAKLLP